MMKVLILLTILHGLVGTNHNVNVSSYTELKAPSLPAGKWGELDLCQEGTVARGFRIKFNYPWINFFDKQGITGIQLMCGNSSFPNFANAPKSLFSNQDSEWQGPKMCTNGSFITAFNLRQDTNDEWFHDSNGATNLKIMCSDGTVLIGDGIDSEGAYTDWLRCPKGEGVVGLRTKVDDNFFDNEGLVTVIMNCQNIIQHEEKIDTKKVDYAEHNRVNVNIASTPRFHSIWPHIARINPVHVTSQNDTARVSPTFSTVAHVSFTNHTNSNSGSLSPALSTIVQISSTNHTNSTTGSLYPAKAVLVPISSTNHTNSNISHEIRVGLPKIADNAENKVTASSNNSSTLQILSSYRDPYLNLPIALEIIILMMVSIFFFIVGCIFKKCYLVKFQEKPFQGFIKAKDGKMTPVETVTDVKISK